MKKKRNGRSGKLPGLRKMVLMMKLCVFFLFASFLSVAANGYSQNTRLSLMKQNASVIEVLTEISQKTDMQFLYNDNELQGIQVNVSLKNATLHEMLDKIFAGLPLSYSILDSVIVISPKGKPLPQALKTVTITGQIKDKDGNPLPGATVRIKDTQMGVVSDQDGKFKLEVGEIKDLMLQVSFIGYKTQTVKPGEQRVLYIVLEEEAQKMDEVVVTGYFTKTKSSYTGSAVTVQAEELKRISPTNLFKALQAYEPSLQIVENNEYGSDPNKLPEILIRGKSSFEGKSNNPLFIMDGYEVDMQKVFDFDIERIKQITILKDASATAIYGSRAANGVIVIETKMPEKGRLTASYNFNATVEIPDLTDYDLLNAAEKLEFERLAGVYKDKDGNIEQQRKLDRLYESRHKEVLRGVNTYWLSKPLRTAFKHTHSLYLGGGNENSRYGININYGNNPGVMKGSKRDRLGLSFTWNYTISQKLRIGNMLSVDQNNTEESPYGNFSKYTEVNPYERAYDDMGRCIKRLSNGEANPVFDATLNNVNKSKSTSFNDNFDFEWYIVEGIRLTGRFAYTYGTTHSDVFVSPKSSQFEDQQDDKDKGSYDYSSSSTHSMDGNIVVNAWKSIDKHMFTLVLGANMQDNKEDNKSFSATGFLSDKLTNLDFAMQYREGAKPRGSVSQDRLIGFFANASYAYDNRYLFDFSYRTDGSSKFGKKNRFAPFWSAGIGWNVDKESFMGSVSWLNMLRLRFSVGSTANVTFSPYQAMTTYNYTTDLIHYAGIGAVPITMGNPDLNWQITMKYNWGLSATLFNERINIDASYYKNKTKDALMPISLPWSVGVSSVQVNMGKLENSGCEFAISAHVIKQKGLFWMVTVNGSHTMDKLTNVSTALKSIEVAQSLGARPSLMFQEGGSQFGIHAMRTAGIDPASGKEIFINSKGEYTFDYDKDERVEVGNSNPILEGSIFSSLSYKGFTLNITTGYKFGGDAYNNTLADKVENINPWENVDRRAFTDRWKEPGDLKRFLGIPESKSDNKRYSERFVERDNLFEIRNISINYEFKPEWLKRFGVKRLNVGFGMNDIARFSSMKLERGTSYPFERSFNITFRPTF